MDNAIGSLLRKMPQHLFERCAFYRPRKMVPANGDYVLYWMRSAMRWDENPAFDTASFLAGYFEKPLMVVQDINAAETVTVRQMTFLVQGVRCLAQQAEQRGIAYYPLLLQESSDWPLPSLASAAVCIVTDSVADSAQVASLHKLDTTTVNPVIGVEANMLVPTAGLPKNHNPAAEYKRQVSGLYQEKALNAWPESPPLPAMWQPARLPFAPLNTGTIALRTWITGLPLNNDVLPVIGIEGGADFATTLWQRHRSEILNSYPDGKSVYTLGALYQAYLECGMLSPFMLAMDSVAADTPQAQRFLEDVLITFDRYNAFAARNPQYQQFATIPLWARTELEIHLKDKRQQQYGWQQLITQQTDDDAWNRHQHALVMAGIVHELDALFWGRRLLEWHDNPEKVFPLMGRLYNTYGLLRHSVMMDVARLHCFGLFDSPHAEPKPVYGRLPIAPRLRHDRAIAVPPVPRWITPKIAVIGAGMAGMACASRLHQQGYDVKVFEERKHPGGRIRSVTFDGDFADIGAPFSAPSNSNIRQYLQSIVPSGDAALWKMRIQANDPKAGLKMQRFPYTGGKQGLIRFLRPLSKGLSISVGNPVTALEVVSGGIRLHHRRDESEFFDYAILAVPPAQTLALLPQECGMLADVVVPVQKMHGIWTITVALARPLPVRSEALAFSGGSCQFAYKISSQPGRKFHHQVWNLHSFPDWKPAATTKDRQHATVLTAMTEALLPHNGGQPVDIVDAHIQHWPEAITAAPLGRHYLYENRIGICGDWCIGRRIEDAYNSGRAIAARLVLETEFSGLS